jgi:predicted acyltransferase
MDTTIAKPSASAPLPTPSPTKGRLLSIDALRGFDMFWIIGGGEVFGALARVQQNPVTQTIHDQLEHVSWAGCHFEDLIYPLFLFIIGIVLPYSINRRRDQGESVGRLYWHFLKRSILLVVLGNIPAGLFTFTKWPFMGGVLSHIGLCYFFAAALILHTGWRTRTGLVAGYLLLYWLALLRVPVPGSGAGDFTEQGCLASYIDRHFISGQLWNEGPASTPSGIVIILWGSLAGLWLRSVRPEGQKAAGLFGLGLASVALGLVWSHSLPMIKRVVWSSSYVTFACGWSLIALAIFYWIIDVQGYRRWTTFFVVIGMNAITIYFLQSIVDFGAIAKFFVQGLSDHSGALKPMVGPLGELGAKWVLLYFLYRNRLFFRL